MSRRKLFESPEPSSQMLGVGPAYVSVEGLRQHLAEFLLYAGRPVVIMRGRSEVGYFLPARCWRQRDDDPLAAAAAGLDFPALVAEIARLALAGAQRRRHLDPNGELAEEVKYEIPAKDGYSAARKSDGAFVWTKNPTPGMNNILLSDSLKTTSSARSSEKVVQENLKISAFVPVAGKSVGVSAADKINFSNLLIKSAQAKIVSAFDEEIAAESGKEAAEDEAGAPINGEPKTLQALEARISSLFYGRNELFLILMSAAVLALFGLSRKLYKS